MLGLIANNFVRVFHPFSNPRHSRIRSQLRQRLERHPDHHRNLRIDAAILSIQHSSIVDHYSCGNPLGTLTVNGAIAQKFRGAVGTFSQQTGQPSPGTPSAARTTIASATSRPPISSIRGVGMARAAGTFE